MDWKAIVKTIAPVLGTALGGPLAGTAVRFLAEQFLGNPNASEQDVATAIIGASPEQLLRVKELDTTFKLKMKELDIDVFRIEVDDRKSARDMARVNMWPQIALSALYTIGYFGVLYGTLAGGVQITEGLRELTAALIGVMTAAQVKIMDFWFGSSYGSKIKDVKNF